MAGLVRLEDEPLNADEINEALRSQIRYTPHDLLVPEWSAALLIDREWKRRCKRLPWPTCNCSIPASATVGWTTDWKGGPTDPPLGAVMVAVLENAWQTVAQAGELRMKATTY